LLPIAAVEVSGAGADIDVGAGGVGWSEVAIDIEVKRALSIVEKRRTGVVGPS